MTSKSCPCSRREFLARGLYGVGVGAGLPLLLSRTSAALAAQALQGTSLEKHPERILVVIELSGGNDGLNTVVPFGDAAYYRARPKLGIAERDVIKVANGFGFHPSMVGFERLYKDGLLERHPRLRLRPSELVSLLLDGLLAYRHPERRRRVGMAGPSGRRDLRGFDAQRHREHRHRSIDGGPQPETFTARVRRSRSLPPGRNRRRAACPRRGRPAAQNEQRDARVPDDDGTECHRELGAGASGISDLSHPCRLWVGGGLSINLQRVAALIAAEMPTRLYYVSYQGNAFDTHVQQADLHGRLLMYTADAVRGFLEDVNRIGRKDDVAVMLFTEFGRRVEENGSLGTDHGTATPMFVAGHGVKGGFYGTAPEPDRPRRREHEDDDRFQACVRHR